MPGFFDNHTLSIPCGKCGHETEQTVSRLKTSPEITCPTCRVATRYNAAELREGIRRAEKALEKVADDLWEKLSKTIKLGHE